MKKETCLVAFTKDQLYQLEPKNWPNKVPISKDRVTKEAGKKSKLFFWYPSLDNFIQNLCNSQEPWYYEIIDDLQPCCMYFDIEWYHNCAGFSSGEHVIQSLLESYLLFSEISFGKENATLLEDWKILCATGTDDGVHKFSYHLIDRSGFVINNSRERKTVAYAFSAYLYEQKSPLCQLLSEKNEMHPPVDMSVYSRWQQFRTIWSSKIKSDRILLPVDLNGNAVKVSQEECKLYFISFCFTNSPSRIIECVANEKVHTGNKTSISVKQHSHSLNLYWDVNIKKDPKSEVTLQQNNGSIEFYLQCIPNSGEGQHWDIYFTIAAAVHRAKGSFETFCAWASKSTKYSQAEAQVLWNSLEKQDRKIGYNGGTLRNLARFCSPVAFESTMIDFTTKMSLECYASQFMHPLPLDKSVVICQSPMGSGKTYGMSQLISKVKPVRALILSSRLTYTDNVIKDINHRLLDHKIQFQSYLDLKDNVLNNVNYLVIQMESLHKLEDIDFNYDLLLIDESEACLRQFNSATMTNRKDVLWKNLATFKKLFVTAKRKVLLDAFISNRSIDFVENMHDTTENCENCVVLVNTKVESTRTAFQYKNESVWVQRILQEICQNKKVVIFWGSKSKGCAFEKYLSENLTGIKVKYYHSDGCNKEMKADLENVRETWKDTDVLMYTSKITVGVNFDKKDVFDSIFVYAASNGCSARDVIQATMRVRHIKENKLHFYVNGFNDKSKIDIDALKYRLAIKNQMLEKLDEEFIALMPNTQSHLHRLHVKWHTEDHWLVHLYLQNALEQQQSNLRFTKVFRKFLKKAGYVIEFVDTDSKFSLEVSKSIEYIDIPTIDQAQLDILQLHISGDLTLMQKLSISKYFFRKKLLPNLPFNIETYLWNIWVTKPNVIINIQQEITLNGIDVFNKDKIKIGLKSFMPSNSIMLDSLKTLYRILQLKNSLDTRATIPATNVNALLENQDFLKRLRVSFNKGEPIHCNKKQALGLVNSVLKTWCEAKLVIIEGSRKQSKKNNSYNYRLENTIEKKMSEECNSNLEFKDVFHYGSNRLI